MVWESILKKMPKDRADFAKIITDDFRFNKLLSTLDRYEAANRQIPANATIKDMLRRYENNTMTPEIILALGDAEYPKEKLEENIKTLLDRVSYKDANMNKRILEEGLELLERRDSGEITENELDRLSKIYQEILEIDFGEQGQSSRRTSTRNMQAQRNTFLSNFSDFILTFANTGENFEEKVGKFARKMPPIGENGQRVRLGQVIDGKLFTKFKDGAEFLAYARQNKDAFNELVRPFGPNLSALGTKAPEKGAKAKLQELHAKKVVFEPANINSITEVNGYFDVIAQLPGKKGIFMPRGSKTKGATAYIPPSVFLLKEDGADINRARSGISTLRLNPYANRILLSGFTKDTWFADLFRGVKMKLTSDSEAESILYEDISRAYEKEETEYVDASDFVDLENLSDNKQTRKTQIERFIERNGLRTEMNALLGNIKEERFGKDTKNLTIREAKRIEDFWKGLTKDTIEDYDYIDDFNVADNEDGGIGELDLKRVGDSFEIKYRGAGEEKSEKIGVAELMQVLEPFGYEQESKMKRVRDYLGREEPFESYMMSLSSEEINEAVEAGSGSRAFMDRIDPLNSLSFLSNLNEMMYGRKDAGYVKKNLLAIASEQNPSKKGELIKELNDKMLILLRDMTEFLFETIEDRLEIIGKDYLKQSSASQHKAMLMALKLFKDANLLTGGVEL